jgi:hypothetical protein
MSSQLQVTGEAKIRDIQGPVVANSGVITALDGAASQYVRGDGTLADFPTSSGGGSSVSYYLNSSVSQGTIGGVAYRELSKEPIIGAGTDIAISTTGYVASYLTDANDPDVLSIPGGNFNCEFYFSVNNNTGNPFFYAELYKYDGTTFTLLGSSVGVPEYINQGTIIAPYYFAIPVATAALALTDRLAIRIYVNVDGRTVTLHTENGHLCQVVTTLSKGMVSLNNLTDQSQFITTGTSGTNFAIVSSGDTHTFNLPVASAANTGKLSSSDWSTFNAKEPAITAGTTLQYYRGDKTFQTLDTTAVIEATNLYFTDARARAALSFAAGSGAYNSTTGVITIPTNTNQLTNGASFITLTSLSAGTGISYNNTTGVITNSAPDQTVSLTAGAGILITGTYPSFTIASTITQYTDALARAAISLTTTGSSGDATYNNTTGVFNIPNYGSALSGYVPYTGATTNVNLGVNSLTATGITVSKSAGISTITFPAGTNDPAFIQHEESSANTGIMRFSVGDDNDATDYFVFGNVSSGFVERFRITSSGIVNLGTWQGSAIADAYISSASTWNAKQNQLNGTGFVKATGTTISYDNSTYLTTSAASSTYVPYTGATANLDMGTGTFGINTGRFLLFTKNGAAGIGNSSYVGFLNASATDGIYAQLNASNNLGFYGLTSSVGSSQVAFISRAGDFSGNSFIKTGGTSSQFLKADGSVDSTSYYPTSGGIISGNIYMQSSANPSQLLAKGVNTEFWVDSQYGGGTARAFINRNGVGNQATLMFSTGVVVTNGTAWAGVCDYSMGMTNDGTGNFYIGAGDLFSSGNRALTISSSKNIGIGTNPSAWSTANSVRAIQNPAGSIWNFVNGNMYMALNYYWDGSNRRYVNSGVASEYQQSGDHSFYTAPSGSAGNVVTFTERMRITSGGNVGIGTPSPSALLHLGVANAAVDGTKGVKITNPAGTTVMLECGVSSDSFVGTTSASDFSIRTGNSERMRITSGGVVQITNAGDAQLKLAASGSTAYVSFSNSAGDLWGLGNSFAGATTNFELYNFNAAAYGFKITRSGIYATTASSPRNVYVQSDGTLGGISSILASKTNIQSFDTNWLYDLNPIQFNYRKKDENEQYTEEFDTELFYGLIAEETELVNKEICNYNENKLIGIEYSKLVPVLVKAIQELKLEIEELKELIKNK